MKWDGWQLVVYRCVSGSLVLFDVLGNSPLADAVNVFLLVVGLVSALVEAGFEFALVELHASHEEFHVEFGVGDTLLVLLESVQCHTLYLLSLFVLKEVLLDLCVGEFEPEGLR